MTAASIPASRGGAYARYLESKTIEPGRGDYYLSPDGEPVQAPGRWLSLSGTLARLGIEDTTVQGRDFLALMEGRDPQGGGWLRAEGAGGGRGGGVDVTFSAPKSVSVVWALGDPWQRKQIEQAHAAAVEQAVLYMREQVPLVRRRHAGRVIEEPARDVLAAEYRHTTARGVAGGGAPDPQLHSHVVITGVVREDERVVAVASRPVFRSAREVGAFYRSALADQLAEAGYAIEQGTGRDGRYFEIAGVPHGLTEAFSGRSREVARAAERFRARYGRAPERGELRGLALENRRAKRPATTADLQRVWAETGQRHGFGPDEALQLLAGRDHEPTRPAVEDRIEQRLTEQRAVFDGRELRAAALERTTGEMAPDVGLAVAREMIRDRRVIPLEGGRLTTLNVRAQEQAIERRADQLAKPVAREVADQARERAAADVAERIGAPLTSQQREALRTVTGPERLTVLVGQAGTGKGVVIDAATRAEQHAGRQVLGIAVSGSTAERLGTDSPALAGRTLTLDALIARASTGSVPVGRETTIVLDEAGMADHYRLHALTELVERSGAKLIAVGDGKQLPSIGPGGMFDRLARHAPRAELGEIHRTRDPAEQRAWQALRSAEPERAMAHYQAQGRLHLTDTRDQAAENAVQAWASLTDHYGIRGVALIADASNQEIDRLNARAQHLRAQRGDLGSSELPLTSTHYGLHEGDHVAFTAQHRPRGQPRVENGTRAHIDQIHPDGTLALTVDGSGRRLRIGREDAEVLRLAYAQHIYRQQGATVERAVILTGGWQTSKETAYVEATRARHGTDWHIARDQLGQEGQDPQRIDRLAQFMRSSRRHVPSTTYQERADPAWTPTRDPLHVPNPLDPPRWLLRTLQREAPDHDLGHTR